jgi:hypothetical protein
VISKADRGDKLTITATANGAGYLWGKSQRGWIVLTYTDYAAVVEGDKPQEPTEPEATKPTEPEVTKPTEPEATKPQTTEPEATEGEGGGCASSLCGIAVAIAALLGGAMIIKKKEGN